MADSKNKKSKGRINIIITIAIILATVILLYFIFAPNVKKNDYCKSEYVDNTYNNLVLSGGDLTRIEDKLYFNYDCGNATFGFLKMGLYEINSDGSSRMIDDHRFYFGALDPMFRLTNKDNNLLMAQLDNITYLNFVVENGQDGINRYNPDTQKSERLYTPNIPKPESMNSYIVDGDKIYYITESKIYVSDDGVNLTEVFANVHSIYQPIFSKLYYISNNYIYYITKEHKVLYVKKYDMSNHKQVWEKEINFVSDEISDIFVYNDNIIITCHDEHYCYSIYKMKDNETEFSLLYSDNEPQEYFINSYKDKIMLSAEEKGLITVDINTSAVNKLIDKGVMSTYVIDNEWIYYTDKTGRLHRISNDGTKNELVFGSVL